MTRKRMNEIERIVFYRHISKLSDVTAGSVIAFEVGRIIGMMQEDFRTEIEKEVEE